MLNELFDLDETIAGSYLKKYTYPWEVLADIGSIIKEIGEKLLADKYTKINDDVWIANDASVAETASITGPCIIGEKSEVRHCAYIRGNALVGAGCVVGNSTELKNVILFNKVAVPHYNYVGDSILGFASHMGAGSITSNVKSDKTNICINLKGKKTDTGLRKIGAFLGDRVEVGCGSVLNPGTIIGRDSIVYPLSSVRGEVAKESIYKSKDEIVKKKL